MYDESTIKPSFGSFARNLSTIGAFVFINVHLWKVKLTVRLSYGLSSCPKATFYIIKNILFNHLHAYIYFYIFQTEPKSGEKSFSNSKYAK